MGTLTVKTARKHELLVHASYGAFNRLTKEKKEDVMAIKEVQIAGTFRECEQTKRYWAKKRVSVQDAERIWKSKTWDRFLSGKGGNYEQARLNG